MWDICLQDLFARTCQFKQGSNSLVETISTLLGWLKGESESDLWRWGCQTRGSTVVCSEMYVAPITFWLFADFAVSSDFLLILLIEGRSESDVWRWGCQTRGSTVVWSDTAFIGSSPDCCPNIFFSLFTVNCKITPRQSASPVRHQQRCLTQFTATVSSFFL